MVYVFLEVCDPTTCHLNRISILRRTIIMKAIAKIIDVIYGLSGILYKYGKKALGVLMVALPFSKKPTIASIVKESALKLIPDKFRFHLN
jgi:hypothetical protein